MPALVRFISASATLGEIVITVIKTSGLLRARCSSAGRSDNYGSLPGGVLRNCTISGSKSKHKSRPGDFSCGAVLRIHAHFPDARLGCALPETLV